MLMLIPLLQVVAAMFTIFGFFNAPHVTDTVLTYGMSGENAPNLAMLFNSYGSIALGIATFVGTHFLKNKMGLSGPFYAAVLGFIKSPSDKVAIVTLALAVIAILEKHFVDVNDPNDAAAIEYIRSWITSKFVSTLSPPKS